MTELLKNVPSVVPVLDASNSSVDPDGDATTTDPLSAFSMAENDIPIANQDIKVTQQTAKNSIQVPTSLKVPMVSLATAKPTSVRTTHRLGLQTASPTFTTTSGSVGIRVIAATRSTTTTATPASGTSASKPNLVNTLHTARHGENVAKPTSFTVTLWPRRGQYPEHPEENPDSIRCDPGESGVCDVMRYERCIMKQGEGRCRCMPGYARDLRRNSSCIG